MGCNASAEAPITPEDLQQFSEKYRSCISERRKDSGAVSLYSSNGGDQAVVATGRTNDLSDIPGTPGESPGGKPSSHSIFGDALAAQGLVRQPTMHFFESTPSKKLVDTDADLHADIDADIDAVIDTNATDKDQGPSPPEQAPYLGPIRLISLEDFTVYGEVPRYPDCNTHYYKNKMKNNSKNSGKNGRPPVFDIHQAAESEHFDRSQSLIVFVSHCWIAGWDGCTNGVGIGTDWEHSQGRGRTNRHIESPEHAHNWRGAPHPDNISNDKHRLICDGVRQIWESQAARMQHCYLWMDFCCIDQSSDPAGELMYLDQIVANADCLFTPVVDPDWRAWQPMSASKMLQGTAADVGGAALCDECIYRPAGRLQTVEAEPSDNFVQDWFQSYKAPAFQGSPRAYLERAWCRVEMLFASNIPISASSPIRHELEQAQLHDTFASDGNDHKGPTRRSLRKLLSQVSLCMKALKDEAAADADNADATAKNADARAIAAAEKSSHAALVLAAERLMALETKRRENFSAGLRRITSNGWRPHFLYGTMESEVHMPVKVMPPLSYTFIDSYSPLDGGLSVESDRVKISQFMDDLSSHIAHAKNAYVGTFSGATQQKCGQGMFTYADGSVFEGRFENDKREGEGTFTWVNGGQYVGSYRADMRDGYGVYEAPHGAVYRGQWKNNLRHGQGTMTTMHEVLTGQFRDNHFSQGRQVFKSGDVYEGTLVCCLSS